MKRDPYASHHPKGFMRSFLRNLRIALLAALFVTCVSSCFGEQLKAASRLRDRIHAEYGVNANVHTNEHNGVLKVTIQLESLPPGSPEATRKRVEALAKSEFPSASEVIVVGKL
jgi:hypothetical protein